MSNSDIYSDISQRTNGAIMLGVVGPVRTGKSSFIKRFMETLVIPRIEDPYMRERALDELPQSGSGRTIMTAEPKFVPEDAVTIALEEGESVSVRLVDCVGYMVSGASGQLEDGEERMVTTPWFDREVTMTEAAEKGTSKVIGEHSTIGIVVTCDGSICDIPRSAYIEAEERVITELKSIGKPFVLILNSAEPKGEAAAALAAELEEKYGVGCICLNCLQIGEDDIHSILRSALYEFPVQELPLWLPSWLNALPDDSELKQSIYFEICTAAEGAHKLREVYSAIEALSQADNIESAAVKSADLGKGTVNISVTLPKALYYREISSCTGLSIGSDAELFGLLGYISSIKSDYEHIKNALNDVREKGYGVVEPLRGDISLGEPKIVKQGGKYSVKIGASAQIIHMISTDVETVVSPSLTANGASGELMGFLLQGFEGDMSELWESDLFGRSLYDLAEEGISEKLGKLPENARTKLKDTLERIINEGSGTLICIVL